MEPGKGVLPASTRMAAPAPAASVDALSPARPPAADTGGRGGCAISGGGGSTYIHLGSNNFEQKGTGWVQLDELVAGLGLDVREARRRLLDAPVWRDGTLTPGVDVRVSEGITWVSATGREKILGALLALGSNSPTPGPVDVQAPLLARAEGEVEVRVLFFPNNPHLLVAQDEAGQRIKVRVRNQDDFRRGMVLRVKREANPVSDVFAVVPPKNP